MARRALPTAAVGFVLGAVVSLAGPAAGSAAADPATGRIVVLARPGTAGTSDARAALARAGARPSGPAVPQIGLVTVRPRPGESLAQAAVRLAATPGVRSVQPEHRMRLRALPDDPALHEVDPAAGTALSPLPAGTVLEWPLLRSGFPGAWEVTRGERALVGVIDTGVDETHPELASKLAAVIDQTGSGHGNVPSAGDREGHGTHVASLACAVTGNGIGIAGAGRDCRLVVEKTDLTDASIAASIVDATDRGVQAINMSFGDDGSRPASDAIRSAIRYAVHRRVVLVAAAADEPVREQGDPANVLQPSGTGADIRAGIGLSVTAATWSGQRAPFAGRGSQISLAAFGTAGIPGTEPPGVIGAFPAGTTALEQGSKPCGCRTAIAGDPRYGYLAGTSMAAPQVAAVAALVRALNPDLPVRAVVRLLKRTASRPPRAGWSAELGWGILDAGRAVRAASRIDLRRPVSHVSAAPGARRGTIALHWTADDPAPEGVAASGVRSVELTLTPVRGGRTRSLTARAGVRDATVRVEPGGLYAVVSQALDRAGNRERAPRRPEQVLRAPR
jgi:serine protease